MNTPICDFVNDYYKRQGIRLHMPGHKGVNTNLLGLEQLDITEISDADDLFHPEGIVLESEKNCSKLFGFDTYYSTEGSSLGIRTMLYLCKIRAQKEGCNNVILASRNCHRTFITGLALLDIDVNWLKSDNDKSYISSDITAQSVSDALKASSKPPMAVYITSPDYAGKILNIGDIAKVCHEHNVPLIVDNAHGAYLKFLNPSIHPIDLGADMCVDSAHKTLPVLTGGAYIHIGNGLMKSYSSMVKDAMVMFGSTSPSWIILQSLDNVNKILFENLYKENLNSIIEISDLSKAELNKIGFELIGDEPLKISVIPQSVGADGLILGGYLKKNNIEPEFISKYLIVFMLTPSNTKEEINRLVEVLVDFVKDYGGKPIDIDYPSLPVPKKIMSVREASLCPFEYVPLTEAKGRVAALGNTSCPPAIPIVMSGELVDEDSVKALEFYGYERLKVCLP